MDDITQDTTLADMGLVGTAGRLHGKIVETYSRTKPEDAENTHGERRKHLAGLGNRDLEHGMGGSRGGYAR